MRSSKEAITGSKQIFEPVVKGTLHTRVRRNPMSKQMTYKHGEVLSSAEVLQQFAVSQTCRVQQRFRAKSQSLFLPCSSLKESLALGKSSLYWVNHSGGCKSAVSLTTGQQGGKAMPQEPYLQ